MGRSKVSAGIVMFRRREDRIEIFLVHPGGPFWSRKDKGAWMIPKGEVDLEEDLLSAAIREFEEETGFPLKGEFIPLGSVRQKGGKLVHAWAVEGEIDPSRIRSNMVQMEWPKGSGRWISFPEIDRASWFDLPTAREKINPAQMEFIERIEAFLSEKGEDRGEGL